jgi:hypothetical protein
VFVVDEHRAGDDPRVGLSARQIDADQRVGTLDRDEHRTSRCRELQVPDDAR